MLAFGVAWATAVAIYGTGGISGSRQLAPGVPITYAAVLLPTFYMFSPAVAHLVTRVATREGWSDLRLRPRLGRRRWRYWLLAWFLPTALTVAGALAFFALFTGSFDPSLGSFRDQLSAAEGEAGQPPPVSPEALVLIQVLLAVSIGPIINTFFAFGEEFGWRAYLQPKLLGLVGPRRAMVLMGAIWGFWHWPLIAMGYQYGSGYPGAPWSGMLLFVLFAFGAGTVLGWLAWRGESVWPAAIAHGTINATAGLPLLALSGNPASPLLGPLPVGAVGSLAWAAAAILILWRWSSPEKPPQT